MNYCINKAVSISFDPFVPPMEAVSPDTKLRCFDYEELGEYGDPGRQAREGCGICPCKKK